MVKNKLNQLKAIVSEHFDDYLIVVSKGSSVYNVYNSKLSAMGMCKMVENDIKNSWSEKEDSPVEDNG